MNKWVKKGLIFLFTFISLLILSYYTYIFMSDISLYEENSFLLTSIALCAISVIYLTIRYAKIAIKFCFIILFTPILKSIKIIRHYLEKVKKWKLDRQRHIQTKNVNLQDTIVSNNHENTDDDQDKSDVAIIGFTQPTNLNPQDAKASNMALRKYITRGVLYFLIILMIVLIPCVGIPIVIIVYFYRKKKKNDKQRRKDWQDFAKRHRFTYFQDDQIGLSKKLADYPFFRLEDVVKINERDVIKAYNICQGREKDRNIYTFDFKRKETYYFGGSVTQYSSGIGIIVETPLVFKSPLIIMDVPNLIISYFSNEPLKMKNFLRLLAGKFHDHIGLKFEWAEFSKRFYVNCNDKEFGYTIVHPQMINFLMDLHYRLIKRDKKGAPLTGPTTSTFTIEAQLQTVLFHRSLLLTIPDMENLLLDAHKFFDLIPDSVEQSKSTHDMK